MTNAIPIKKDQSVSLMPLSNDRRFGTDGIRGPVDTTMNPLFVTKLGWAAGTVLLEEGISRSDERIKKDLNLIGVDYGPGSNWEKWQLYNTKIRFFYYLCY